MGQDNASLSVSQSRDARFFSCLSLKIDCCLMPQDSLGRIIEEEALFM